MHGGYEATSFFWCLVAFMTFLDVLGSWPIATYEYSWNKRRAPAALSLFTCPATPLALQVNHDPEEVPCDTLAVSSIPTMVHTFSVSQQLRYLLNLHE